MVRLPFWQICLDIFHPFFESEASCSREMEASSEEIEATVEVRVRLKDSLPWSPTSLSLFRCRCCRLVLSKLRQCELLAMKAFAIWKHNVALSRCIGSAASQQYRLQIELLAYKARIHELSTSSDLMASLAAERALNK